MTPVVLVLADRADLGAAAVARALAGRLGGDRVLPLSPAELARARWSHRVSAAGTATTRLTFPDGQVLTDTGTAAVLHRLSALPVLGLGRASPKDLDYARAELHALVAGWLLGLGSRVLGLVSAYGTAHGPLSPTTALVHAERCGLPVARSGGATRGGLLTAASGELELPRPAWPGGANAPVPVEIRPEPGLDRLLYCGSRPVGRLADRYGPRLHRLAGLLGTRLFELRLGPDGSVTDVDPCPPLATAEQRAAVTDELVALARSGS
ncbi:hypothetical protein ACIRPK_02245 [Kitasatospora sp. NPDC101801]|uniref:hypothetical protein n=1 Tax=Kitasatospora sp. NPDC101801 TaxID=3364103 RepID=UPI0038113DF2